MENFLKEQAEFLGILLLHRFVIKAKPVKELKIIPAKTILPE